MKKIILALAVILSMTFATTAQAISFDWGITGGYSLTKLKMNGEFNQVFNSDNRSGWFVGAKANVGLIMGFGLDGALLYSQQKLNLNDQVQDLHDRSRTQRTIAIPLNLKYSIGVGRYFNVYLATGPQFDFCLNDNSFNIASEEYTGVLNRETMTTSWNVGAGTRILKHLDLGVSYNFGISKVGRTILHNLSDSEIWNQQSAKSNTFNVQMTYYF